MKRFKQSVLLGLMMVFAIGLCSWANPGTDLSPVLNEGKKWRIGYCESEPFVNYAFTLHALLEGLGALGWMTGIPEMPFQEGQGDTSRMWEWLATHDIGPSLECVPDAHYTLSELTPDAQATILTRLQDGKDIDLLLVMGTRAGLLITKKEPPVSTLVFSTSNAEPGSSRQWIAPDTRMSGLTWIRIASADR
ncbi:MAG: hypothetical protein NTX88_08660 [Candidatus Atribacteria bacterium]|nr:hypothetical protein [Candidatus Atribacteria bacterium]